MSVAHQFGSPLSFHRDPLQPAVPLATIQPDLATTRGPGAMRKFLLKTSFISGVLALTLAALLPAQLLLEMLLPAERSGDRLLPGILVVAGCLAVSNRIVSFVFGRTGLSDKRWSVFSRRTFG